MSGLAIIAIIAFGGWFLWRKNRQQMRRYQEPQEQVLAEKRAFLNLQLEQAQQQERAAVSNRAFEHLKAPDLELRLAALHTLESLLHEVLPWEQWNLLKVLQAHLQTQFAGQPLSAPLPADLVALFRLFSKRPTAFQQREAGGKDRLEFHDLDLSGLHLNALNLRASRLSNCQFLAADLPQFDAFAAEFQALDFSQSNLVSANFTGARCERVSFIGARLQAAEFIRAELIACQFQDSDLGSANFRGARLQGCDFSGANLSEVSQLTFQQMKGCRLDSQTRLLPDLSQRRAQLLAAMSD